MVHTLLCLAYRLGLAGLSALTLTISTASMEPGDKLPSPETRAVKAERWWRIQLYERDRGRWRSAGTFENPDLGRCIRYGDGWVAAGKRGSRAYTGPVSFLR